MWYSVSLKLDKHYKSSPFIELGLMLNPSCSQGIDTDCLHTWKGHYLALSTPNTPVPPPGHGWRKVLVTLMWK